MAKQAKIYVINDGGFSFGMDAVTPVSWDKVKRGNKIYTSYNLTPEQAKILLPLMPKIATLNELKRIVREKGLKKNPRRATKKRAVKRNPGKVGRPRKTQADINRKKILTAYKPYVVQMQTKAGGKWFGVGRFDTKSEAVKHATILHNDLKSFAFRVVLL